MEYPVSLWNMMCWSKGKILANGVFRKKVMLFLSTSTMMNAQSKFKHIPAPRAQMMNLKQRNEIFRYVQVPLVQR